MSTQRQTCSVFMVGQPKSDKTTAPPLSVVIARWCVRQRQAVPVPQSPSPCPQLTADAVSLFDCLSVNWIKQKFPSCRISIAFQVWDPNLASEAAQWTKNCIYEFQYGSHGENMYYFETKLPDNVLIERAIDAWYSERYSWRMSGDCAEACSYTQVSRAFYLRSTP